MDDPNPYASVPTPNWGSVLARYFRAVPAIPKVTVTWESLVCCFFLYALLESFAVLVWHPNGHATESQDATPRPAANSHRSAGEQAPERIEADTVSQTPEGRGIVDLFFVKAAQGLFFVFGALILLRVFSPGYVSYRLSLHNAPRAILLGVQHALLWTPVVLAFSAAVSSLVPERDLHPALTALKSARGFALIPLWISVVIAAPMAEELLFRGLFQSALAQWRWKSGWIAIVVASALFAMLHPPTDRLPLFLLSLGLGLSYVYTDSLWTPIAFHTTFNAINMAIVLMIR